MQQATNESEAEDGQSHFMSRDPETSGGTERGLDLTPQILYIQGLHKVWSLYNLRYYLLIQFSSVAQSCLTFATPWTVARQGSLSITNSQSSLKSMSIESVMPSNHLILSCPLLLTSIVPRIRVFANESALRIRWPKNWSFSFSISTFNEHSGLISFIIDWLDLLAVQGTLKSLLQHHSSKASIL